MAEETQTLDRLGPYRILRELGAGGMGTVYLADDLDEERQVALKVLHPHLVEREGFFKRFQREAQAGEKVDHPNVVRTLDSGFHMHGGKPHCVLAMEYVEGQTLRDLLREYGTVPEALVRELALQTAEGLAAIHEAGIVHRDLKPENVLITKEHEVRIMDLGVARWTQASTALTREGQFAGSLPYAAPEQFGQAPVGPSADLYALGVVLYELLSGRNPFHYEEPARVVRAHLEEMPEALVDATPDVTLFLSALVSALLAKSASGRFGSAATLAVAIRQGEDSAWFVEREASAQAAVSRLPRVPVRRETRLHGRESDLQRLRSAWEKARGGLGQCVLVEGEAGIGKSRLVAEFLSEIHGSEAHVLYGSYSPSGGPGGLFAALCEHFGAARLEDAVREHLSALPRLVPAFASLLVHHVPPDHVAGLDTQGIHSAFVHLMRSLAADRPLVWVVEDLHFAEADALATLLSLARGLEEHPVLLFLTARPDVSETSLAHLSNLPWFERSHLGRLSPREVILLLQEAFRNDALAEKLGGKIALKSDGIPFFVFEMIRGLKEGQFIAELPDGSWIDTQEIEEIEIPSAVRDLIEARLQDLTREEREILDVASVLGFEFEADLVARVQKALKVATLRALAHIEQRSGVVRAVGRSHRFDHHQIQEIVYAALPLELREEYHAMLASSLAEREGVPGADPASLRGSTSLFLARHLLNGPKPEDALPHLVPAARHLRDTHRPAAGIDLYSRALATPGLLAGKDRTRTLRWLYECFELIGDQKRAWEAVEEALALSREVGDRHCEAWMIWIQGKILGMQGKSEAALNRFALAMELSLEIGDVELEALSQMTLGDVLSWCGRPQEARSHVQEALRVARTTSSKVIQAKALIGVGSMLWKSGELEAARSHYEEARTLLADGSDPTTESVAVNNLGLVAWHEARLEEAEGFLLEALALAREAGHRSGEASTLSNLGNVQSLQGRAEEAWGNNRRALRLAQEVGDLEQQTYSHQSLGAQAAYGGRNAETREHCTRALHLSREIGNRSVEAYALSSLADLHQEAGDDAEAEHGLREVLAIRQRIEEPIDEGWTHNALGALLADQGRWEAARPHLDEALRLGREHQARDLEVLARVNRGRLPGGDVLDAGAALSEHGHCVNRGSRMMAHFVLWRMSGASTHLAESRRLQQELVAEAPEAWRQSMLTEVRQHREIESAWAAHAPKEESVVDGDTD